MLVIGPWFHGGWVRSDGDWLGTAYFRQKTSVYFREKIEFPFFNYFLKNKGEISHINEINAFDTGINQWRTITGFETENNLTKNLYLVSNGKLSFTKPLKNNKREFDEYLSDPQHPVPYTQKMSLVYPYDYMTEDQRFCIKKK